LRVPRSAASRWRGSTSAILICLTGLTGCGSLGLSPRLILDPPAEVAGPSPKPKAPAPGTSRGGAYYKDDGPGDNPPDLAAIADAQPRVEPLHRFANNPYNVFGVAYTPQRAIAPFRQRGLGSWYGRKFHGQRTSSGEVYDMYGMTAAHPTLPIPSYARVTSVTNGRSVIVRVNDRGPFHPRRVIDLSYTAAWKLGYVNAGSAPVEVELLTPELIAALNRKPPAAASIAQAGPVPPPEVTTAPAQAVAAAPSTAAAAPTALAMDVQPSGVFLQLAAFSARDNAEAFRARVYRELDWLTDGIQILQRDGLFRLHLGPYRDRGEAGGIAERIRAALEVRPVIVVR
jgi:rare lipoprotein A